MCIDQDSEEVRVRPKYMYEQTRSIGEVVIAKEEEESKDD